MRLNQFLARHSNLSRRGADVAIDEGRVTVNGRQPSIGLRVSDADVVTLDGVSLVSAQEVTTIMLNKPSGYVCSRMGQGSQTVYDLLPPELHNVKPVGRLDKESTGLLLMTNDGDLANKLTHPRYKKTKVYEITLNQALSQQDFGMITKTGVELDDGISKFQLSKLKDDRNWQVTMSEGRNRQIRRTFARLNYRVNILHRTKFGDYELKQLQSGLYQHVR